jgi:indolepyruvate ferredoxin oxidoreductase
MQAARRCCRAQASSRRQVVARAIMSRLRCLNRDRPFEQRLAGWKTWSAGWREAPLSTIRRTPFFCSGCPHSTSTRLPERQPRHGRHRLPFPWRCFIPNRNTATLSQMGGEEPAGLGRRPSPPKHVFQDLGDGTYAHSGLTAIRAAAAAGRQHHLQGFSSTMRSP